jgi:hypothetical protein
MSNETTPNEDRVAEMARDTVGGLRFVVGKLRVALDALAAEVDEIEELTKIKIRCRQFEARRFEQLGGIQELRAFIADRGVLEDEPDAAQELVSA